ncbi:MAG: oligosaccharide flippase family protein [Candidatus Gracilibacteria bacterium]|nr:oligosaccharide flippase family protein [Candidatus Gracilibacteria bacterium]
MIEQHNTLAEKFLKKGIWLYVFSFIISPIGYIIKIILSGDLEVDEIGIIYGVMSLMVLVSSFNDLGMAESLNKFLPEYITEKRYDKVKSILVYAVLAQIITGGIIFLGFYFGANYLANSYFHDVRSLNIVKLFSFFFLGTTFFHVINVFFGAVQNTFLQKITELFRMSFILCFTTYMFLSDSGNIFNYSLSWVLGLYFGIFFTIFLFYKNYYKIYLNNVKVIFSKELFKTIFKYALIVFLGSQAGTLLSQVDMQMIIYMLGNTNAGYYTNYLSIISIPFMIIGPIFGFLFPVFSEMVSKKEFEKIKLIKSIFTKNFLSFSICFSILFFVFGSVISTILFGDKFLMSGIILQYSVLFLSFNFLLQINFSILAANGRIHERLNIILIALAFNTILNFIFIKFMGVVGSALATGFGWILIWILSEIKLSEYFTKFDYKYLFKNIGVFSLIGIFIYFFIIPIFVSINDRIYEFLFLVFISLIYFGIYFIINLGDFKYFYSEIRRIKAGK